MNVEIMFTSFPELETDRLFLRKITLNDAKAIYAYFSQDIVTKYYDVETFDDISEAVQLISTFHQMYEERVAVRWGIALKENNRLIGTCGFHQIEVEHYKLELGYELNPTHWRQGIMTEAVSTIVKYGFEELNTNRIEAYFETENISSSNLLIRCGFQIEGLLKERFYEKGKFVDAMIAGYLSSEYKKKKQR